MAVDKENVLEEYLEKAQNGDVDAQFKIAWAYDQGEGVEQDYVEANKWWQKAAEQGGRVAAYNLALNLRNARGVEGADYENAFKWFLDSANRGYAKAFFKVAWAYDQGEGVEKDYVEANKWWRKAAEQGDRVAQYNLAQNLRNARGVEKPDYEAAEKWYLESAKLGYEKANDRLRELHDEKKVLAQFRGAEILELEVDSRYAEIKNSYQMVCKVLNDVVSSGKPAQKDVLQREVKKFERVCTQYLFDQFLKECRDFDLLEQDKLTNKEKRTIILTVGKMDKNEDQICNALSALEKVNYEVKGYEQINKAVNEIVMQYFFSPGYGCGLNDKYISLKAGEFIRDRYRFLIYAFVQDKKDIVALYSRQILNFILRDTYVSESRRVDWPDKDIDIVKKIEMIERGGYVSEEMIRQCTSVRCHTNLGHHITSAREWNEWDDVKCIEDTILLIYNYLKEVKKVVSLDTQQQEQVRDRLYFWKRNHNSLRFSVDDELNRYTAEKLGECCLEERHSFAAVYGRRLLEMWMKKKFFSEYSQSSLWPEGKDNLLEGINFLCEKNIITESEKREAHEIRKNCNRAMHIESQKDTVCSAEIIYNDIKNLINPKGLMDAEIHEQIREKEKEKICIRYSSSAQKANLIKRKERKTGAYLDLMSLFLLPTIFIVSFLFLYNQLFENVFWPFRVLLSGFISVYPVWGVIEFLKTNTMRAIEKIGIIILVVVTLILGVVLSQVGSKETPDGSSSTGQNVGTQTESTEEQQEYISIYDAEITDAQILRIERNMDPITVNYVQRDYEDLSLVHRVLAYAEYDRYTVEQVLNNDGVSLSVKCKTKESGVYTSIYDAYLTDNQFEKINSRLDAEITNKVSNELTSKSIKASHELYITFCALYDAETVEKVLNEILGVTLNPSIKVKTESTEGEEAYISIYDTEITDAQILRIERNMDPITVNYVQRDYEDLSLVHRALAYAEYNTSTVENVLNNLGLSLSIQNKNNQTETYTSIYDVNLTDSQFEKVKSQLDVEITNKVSNELSSKSITASHELYISFCALYDAEAVEKVLNETLGVTLNP